MLSEFFAVYETPCAEGLVICPYTSALISALKYH